MGRGVKVGDSIRYPLSIAANLSSKYWCPAISSVLSSFSVTFKIRYFIAPFAVFTSVVFVRVNITSALGTEVKASPTVIEDTFWTELLVKVRDSTEIFSLHCNCIKFPSLSRA